MPMSLSVLFMTPLYLCGVCCGALRNIEYIAVQQHVGLLAVSTEDQINLFNGLRTMQAAAVKIGEISGKSPKWQKTVFSHIKVATLNLIEYLSQTFLDPAFCNAARDSTACSGQCSPAGPSIHI